jgi:hypothetical protein
MPLSDELQNLKDSIKSALDTSVEDGLAGKENTEVIENLAKNISDSIQSYFLSAEVQTDDIVPTPLLITTTAGPNAAPVLGASVGEIANADYDFLKSSLVSSYTKIQKKAAEAKDYKETNKILGEDIALSVYGYFLSADILTESTLEAFTTLGVPPGVTPANMPAGEAGTGAGKNTISIINVNNINDFIDSQEIRDSQYSTISNYFLSDNIDTEKLIVQSSGENQVRIIGGLTTENLFLNADIISQFLEINEFAIEATEDQEEDLGVTGLGAFFPILAENIKAAYDKAVESAPQQPAYQEVDQQLGEDIGQAIHDFATSAIIKIGTIYQGGLGEDPPAGSSGAVISATGNPAAPVTSPGAVGAGVGILA